MRLPPAVVRPLAAVTAVSTLGCYSYVPLERETPAAGQDVRLEVAEGMGEPARSYRGRVLRVAGDTVFLSEVRAQVPGSQRQSSRDRVVRIPVSRVESVERQDVSFWKSAALIAGGGVAASFALAGLAGTFTQDLDDGGGDDTDTGDASISVPFP